MVNLVAWFTLVLEANCNSQDNQFPCCFLFLFSFWKGSKRGGNNKETTSLLVLYSDTILSHVTTVADSGGVLWQPVMYFCVNSCTSPSNDYTAVECSNNDQAQLNTHVSVPYWSPDVWLGQSCFEIFSSDGLHDRKWAWHPKIFGWASRASGWTSLSKFLNPPVLLITTISLRT